MWSSILAIRMYKNNYSLSQCKMLEFFTQAWKGRISSRAWSGKRVEVVVMVVMVEMVVLALLVTETADRLILVVENIARHFQTGVRSTKDGQTVFTSKWVRRGTFIVVARGCVSGGTAFDRGLLFLIRERERILFFTHWKEFWGRCNVLFTGDSFFKGGNILSRSLISPIQSKQDTGQIERQKKEREKVRKGKGSGMSWKEKDE